jgi:hypothetical protein
MSSVLAHSIFHLPTLHNLLFLFPLSCINYITCIKSSFPSFRHSLLTLLITLLVHLNNHVALLAPPFFPAFTLPILFNLFQAPFLLSFVSLSHFVSFSSSSHMPFFLNILSTTPPYSFSFSFLHFPFVLPSIHSLARAPYSHSLTTTATTISYYSNSSSPGKP